MFNKILLSLFILVTLPHAVMTKEGELFKEKQELRAVKDELNEFYEIKELEYQKNKAELEKIQRIIKKDEQSILDTKKANQKILDEINKVITSKVMLMYDKMKLSVVIDVFNEMISNGEIDEVFDIMMRIKEKRVMKILKKFEPKTSTILMKKMRINKEKNQKQE
jgi:flagellar motility protein MotE (MotC chaperone)